MRITVEIFIMCLLTLAACVFSTGCDSIKTEQAADRQETSVAKKEVITDPVLGIGAVSDVVADGRGYRLRKPNDNVNPLPTDEGMGKGSPVRKKPVDWQDPRVRLELGIIQLEHLDKAIEKLTRTPALLSPYETHRALAAYYVARANILSFISMESQNVQWKQVHQETRAGD